MLESVYVYFPSSAGAVDTTRHRVAVCACVCVASLDCFQSDLCCPDIDDDDDGGGRQQLEVQQHLDSLDANGSALDVDASGSSASARSRKQFVQCIIGRCLRMACCVCVCVCVSVVVVCAQCCIRSYVASVCYRMRWVRICVCIVVRRNAAGKYAHTR